MSYLHRKWTVGLKIGWPSGWNNSILCILGTERNILQAHWHWRVQDQGLLHEVEWYETLISSQHQLYVHKSALRKKYHAGLQQDIIKAVISLWEPREMSSMVWYVEIPATYIFCVDGDLVYFSGPWGKVRILGIGQWTRSIGPLKGIQDPKHFLGCYWRFGMKDQIQRSRWPGCGS